ncbi:MAG: uroporphyrinogen-III C-methyltransferase [Dermatophilaceae bacterium]
MTTLLGLDLRDRLVLVAGGGPVAAGKVAMLLDAGARVVVVAPALCEDLVDAFAAHRIGWEAREVAQSDLDDAWFVVAATGDRAVDEAVCRWATSRRLWSINAGSAEHGTARSPALLRRAGLAIGIVSEQAPDPRRIVVLRDELAAVPDLVHDGEDPKSARESIDAVIASAAVDLRRRRPQPGRVTLVGGGPGAEDLMTIRGRIALSEADVVITDRLGPRSILGRLPVDVEVIHVGKVPGGHGPTQAEINALIIEQAQRGRHVVRLKGGDPFLFGRGGEEVLACREHGIPVEVVPGVSSALSVPGLAGIPVTHRGTASSVTIAHGHHRLSPTAYAPVADGTTTLVLLMAVTLLADHVEDALAAGVPSDTPVCLIERGSLPDERRTRGRLDAIVSLAAQTGVRAPAIVVIGAVADPRLLFAGSVHPEAPAYA